MFLSICQTLCSFWKKNSLEQYENAPLKNFFLWSCCVRELDAFHTMPCVARWSNLVTSKKQKVDFCHNEAQGHLNTLQETQNSGSFWPLWLICQKKSWPKNVIYIQIMIFFCFTHSLQAFSKIRFLRLSFQLDRRPEWEFPLALRRVVNYRLRSIRKEKSGESLSDEFVNQQVAFVATVYFAIYKA